MSYEQIDLSGFDDIETSDQGSTLKTSKNKLDIVFVIDRSGSMGPLIEGLKKNLQNFVSGLKDNTASTIDYRLGFVAQSIDEFIIRDFTSDASVFARAVSNIELSENTELTLPAIEVASDFDWGENRHRFIIHFTDEAIEGESTEELQRAGLEQLLNKLELKKIKLFHFGAHNKDFERFKKVPGTHYEPHDDFSSIDYSELFSRIGKSVSQQSGSQLQSGNYSGKVYEISTVKITKLQ